MLELFDLLAMELMRAAIDLEVFFKEDTVDAVDVAVVVVLVELLEAAFVVAVVGGLVIVVEDALEALV